MVYRWQNVQDVNLPEGANILSIEQIDGQVYLFAAVDARAPYEVRTIYSVSTAGAFPTKPDTAFRFIATIPELDSETGAPTWGTEQHFFEEVQHA